jgi:hypothetical protein
MFEIRKTSAGQVTVTAFEAVAWIGGIYLWFAYPGLKGPVLGSVWWTAWTYLEHAYAEHLVKVLLAALSGLRK